MKYVPCPHWPHHLSPRFELPRGSVFANLAASAQRFGNKTAINFYGQCISYGQLLQKAEALAGYLAQAGVKTGDRILLDMQNSPQFVVAYYAILRLDAVVVPMNPMNVTEEILWAIEDSGAQVALVAQELFPRFQSLLQGDQLKTVVVGCYSDDLPQQVDSNKPAYKVPPEFAAPPRADLPPGAVAMAQALQHAPITTPQQHSAEDVAAIVYTSGTTGKPKGCMLTHRALNAEVVSLGLWNSWSEKSTALATAPFFHVTGMAAGMNLPIYYGTETIILPRWDRQAAASLIQQHRISHWTNIPTMVVDLLALPDLDQYDLSSLSYIGGGGAAMPEAVAARLFDITGLSYQEGWGLSEVAGAIHLNPVGHEKRQCLGVPFFDVDTRVVDIDSLEEVGPHAVGEIVTRGPSLFSGYWRNTQATQDAFLTLDNQQFFRTGDIGYFDEEGYFFMADRLKRMINASGYKVWPAEVENTLYKHPGIREACVVGVSDPYRGETVKAFVVLKESAETMSSDELMAWSREHMSAYKIPRVIEFVSELPKSGTGKIQWRKLQDEEKTP